MKYEKWTDQHDISADQHDTKEKMLAAKSFIFISLHF